MAALCMGMDFSEELMCAVCLDSWKDPVELLPCGHIFCRECVGSLKTCPVCRKETAGSKTPNRTLVNMALGIRVKCNKCGWEGTREASASHKCDTAATSNNNNNNNNNNAASGSSGGGGAPYQYPGGTSSSGTTNPYNYNNNNNNINHSSPPPPSQPYLNNAPQPVSYGNYTSSGNYGPPPQQQAAAAAPGFGNFSTGVPNSYLPQNSNGGSGGYGASANYYPPPPQQQQPFPSNPSCHPPAQPPAAAAGANGSNNYYGNNYNSPPTVAQNHHNHPQNNRPYGNNNNNNTSNNLYNNNNNSNGNAAGNGGGVGGGRRRYNVIEPSGPRPWTLYSLSQQEYDEILSLFVFFDDDETGELNRQQAGRLARWLNFATTPAQVEEMFRAMDADGSGSLSLGEFLTFLRYNKPDPSALYGLTQSQYNGVMMQFHSFDRNQDGALDMQELTALLLRLGDVRTEAEGQRLFQRIDRDRNGSVSLHEFLLFRAGKA